ncbi:MAG TPA: Gfo/Idh/MocA family oxidoreductase, partial [Methylocella sp.]|nr:Gfo/Idh/MocA family oxidoreductase [Methylocella sp.]
MILVDTALQKRQSEGNPIRVGIVGAGFMAQGLVNQIAHSTPGMRVVAVSNRRPERAIHVMRYAGYETF